MTKLNKNDRVRLTKLDPRIESCGLKVGQKGMVVSTRNIPPMDKEPQCLVDFDGYTGHFSLSQSQVKVVTDITYTIELEPRQVELIYRALTHLNEVDYLYHDDLCDEENDNETGLKEELDMLTKMMDPDVSPRDNGLEPSPTINGLCY